MLSWHIGVVIQKKNKFSNFGKNMLHEGRGKLKVYCFLNNPTRFLSLYNYECRCNLPAIQFCGHLLKYVKNNSYRIEQEPASATISLFFSVGEKWRSEAEVRAVTQFFKRCFWCEPSALVPSAADQSTEQLTEKKLDQGPEPDTECGQCYAAPKFT